MKTLWKRVTGNRYFRLWCAFIYTILLFTPEPEPVPVPGETECVFITLAAIVVWLFWAAVSAAIGMGIAYLMAPKPPKPRHARAVGLEQFTVPTAEEGRPIQVLFGSRYITGPNIVWYGDLQAKGIIERL